MAIKDDFNPSCGSIGITRVHKTQARHFGEKKFRLSQIWLVEKTAHIGWHLLHKLLTLGSYYNYLQSYLTVRFYSDLIEWLTNTMSSWQKSKGKGRGKQRHPSQPLKYQ